MGAQRGRTGLEKGSNEMKLKRKDCLFLISFFWFVLFSCVSAPPPKEIPHASASPVKEIESSKQVRAMNEKLMMSVLSVETNLLAGLQNRA